MIVAGLGCRRGCTAAGLAAVVRLAESTSGLRADALAAPRFKEQEPALHAAAALLGLSLLLVDDAALQAEQPRCPTRSAAALRATGVASVAEAAALAASTGHLLLPRITLGSATCALAGPLLFLPPPPGEGRGEGVVPRRPQLMEAECLLAQQPVAPQPRPPHPSPLPDGEGAA